MRIISHQHIGPAKATGSLLPWRWRVRRIDVVHGDALAKRSLTYESVVDGGFLSA
jgi:hypothetical protein